ncbi:MAG: DUF5320 domain-containing protein [Firmicutes bacterium]|nr:DUF5320 domain-containing protein [Bacillota bacterium]
MPRGDRTGPAGYGPMTGRAAGYCAGFPMPGYMNPQPGFRGAGFGRGRGRGWGRMYGGWGRMYGAPVRAGWMPPYHPSWAAPAYPYGGAYPYPEYYMEYGGAATDEQEVSFLREQAELLKEELEAIQGRLEELGGEKTGDVDKG